MIAQNLLLCNILPEKYFLQIQGQSWMFSTSVVCGIMCVLLQFGAMAYIPLCKSINGQCDDGMENIRPVKLPDLALFVSQNPINKYHKYHQMSPQGDGEKFTTSAIGYCSYHPAPSSSKGILLFYFSIFISLSSITGLYALNGVRSDSGSRRDIHGFFCLFK